MSLKEILRDNDALRRIVKAHKIRRSFSFDADRFISYYAESNSDPACRDYEVLLIVHSLEKGMSSTKPRPFGKKKVRELIAYLKGYDERSKQLSPYKMAISILYAWRDEFVQRGWDDDETFRFVFQFLESVPSDFKRLEVGSEILTKEEATRLSNFDYIAAYRTRHSVRTFDKRPLSDEDVRHCLVAAQYAPTACNRQMVKIYQVKNQDKIDKLQDLIMGLGGFDKEAVSLFVIVFDLNGFTFYGERNQGYLNAGLVAMSFAIALHFQGIGSCFLQWGNTTAEEVEAARILGIKDSERIAVVLGAGYYADEALIPVSHRKTIDEIFETI